MADRDSYLLGELTYRKVELQLSNKSLDLILPLGACEQHGPHLPLSTDQIIAEEIAVRAAMEVGGAFVAPSIPIGVSGHHIDFKGTATVSAEHFVALLIDIVTSLLSHGFDSVYLITGHAGNSASMQKVQDHFDDNSVVAFADWPAQRSLIHEAAEEILNFDPKVVGTHAGHFETSIMLLLRPDLVDQSQYQKGFIGSAAEASKVLMSDGMYGLSSIGVIGDPNNSSKEAGEIYLSALVGHVIEGILSHRDQKAAMV